MVISGAAEQRACPRCGHSLEERQCLVCGGAGTRGLWFWQRSCQACGGTGVVRLCPNEIVHLFDFDHSERSPRLPAAGRTTCPTCHQQATLLACPICGGAGSVPIIDLDPGRTNDLRKNPFLPHASSPSSATIFRSCEPCSATGQIMYCPTCGRLSPHSRSRIANLIHRAGV